ncbi:MAG TPA: hypothetical protein VMF51_16280 [Nocardioides sp.]|uniref:hypothetical protein n=1 Tax=Nocardioides sp. TaxID=35761 RepID=UPI002B8E1CFE|nr:hypothetical protein [Nocardioides sp.]HTW16693.1 hypothetical protein [Nocardioides sp.]
MAVWRRRAPRRDAARSAGTARSDLRIQLPLLWPDGPDGRLDPDALQALSREYARTGRGVEELLADLDQLCSVLGMRTPSRMIEDSSVAWADAFLDTVGGVGPESPEPLAEVERRVMRADSDEWRELVPSTRLLTITWEPTKPDRSALERVMAEVRRTFPGAAVAEQSVGQVVAAVDGDADLDRRTALLRTRCAELVRSSAPTVQVEPGPVDADLARRLFRRAG